MHQDPGATGLLALLVGAGGGKDSSGIPIADLQPASSIFNFQVSRTFLGEKLCLVLLGKRLHSILEVRGRGVYLFSGKKDVSTVSSGHSQEILPSVRVSCPMILLWCNGAGPRALTFAVMAPECLHICNAPEDQGCCSNNPESPIIPCNPPRIPCKSP